MASGGEEEYGNLDNNPAYCSRVLIASFPCVDADYIEDLCQNPPFYLSKNEVLLDKLENYLLDCLYGNDVPSVSHVNFTPHEEYHLDYFERNVLQSESDEDEAITVAEVVKSNEESDGSGSNDSEEKEEELYAEFIQQDIKNLEDKLETLVSILPDANPDILKKFLEENRDNDRIVEEFVETNLLNKNYEKREQYFNKLKNEERLKKYIKDFKVQEFIKEFPEPFEHFENAEKIKPYQETALNFLIKRYHLFNKEYITNAYVRSKHNLSIADNLLQTELGYLAPLQLQIEIHDTLLLQEIAFIQNKKAIRNYLEIIKKKEEKEMKLLKAQKLLLECQCCFDDLKPQDCIECENNHIFCKRCVIKGTNLAVSNGEATVHCFVECDKEISLNVLRRVLPEPNFDALLKKRQEFEIKLANLNNLVNCPFCTYSEELDPEIKIFTCKNSECMKISCRLCRKLNHLPIKCKDVVDKQKARLLVEEELSKTLIRNCYSCGRPYVKSIGCNKMTCICGAKMCYICLKPVYGRSHGGSCRIKSDMYDAAQIQLRRYEVTSQLQKDFPDLKLPDL